MAYGVSGFAIGSVVAAAMLVLIGIAERPGPEAPLLADATPAPAAMPSPPVPQVSPRAGKAAGPAAGPGANEGYVEGVPVRELPALERARRPADRYRSGALPARRPEPANGPEPAWRKYAARAGAGEGLPQIAIVLDDVGLSQYRSDRVIALPRPVTLAVLPYGQQLRGLVARARAAGHEILLHMPMEPESHAIDPGPNALRTGMTAADLAARLNASLDRFEGYVGINNHMGSSFTASPEGMDVVMRVLGERGLLFLDSRTTRRSVAGAMAHRHGVPLLVRDIFIDAERDPAFIRRQLARVERLARRYDAVIAIGHPYPETLRALSAWLPQLPEKGLRQVPVSALASARLSG